MNKLILRFYKVIDNQYRILIPECIGNNLKSTNIMIKNYGKYVLITNDIKGKTLDNKNRLFLGKKLTELLGRQIYLETYQDHIKLVPYRNR